MLDGCRAVDNRHVRRLYFQSSNEPRETTNFLLISDPKFLVVYCTTHHHDPADFSFIVMPGSRPRQPTTDTARWLNPVSRPWWKGTCSPTRRRWPRPSNVHSSMGGQDAPAPAEVATLKCSAAQVMDLQISPYMPGVRPRRSAIV